MSKKKSEKNSLYNNIRKKGEENDASGTTPKKPTKAMKKQDKKIKKDKK